MGEIVFKIISLFFAGICNMNESNDKNHQILFIVRLIIINGELS